MTDDNDSNIAEQTPAFPPIGKSSELPQKALSRLRKISDGNGLAPDKITLKDFQGFIYNFDAEIDIRLLLQTANHSEAGNTKGDQKFNTQQELQNHLSSYQDTLLTSPDSYEVVRKIFMERDDRGIGLSKEKVKVPSFQKRYVVPEPCSPCRQRGRIECHKCHGHKIVDCQTCHGQGHIHCHQCRGNRTVPGPDGKPRPCPTCASTGQVNCTYCRGQRHVTCELCNGKGDTKCTQCNGHGVHSHVTVVNVEAIADSRFNAADTVPETVIRQAEKLGPRLVGKHHAKAIPAKRDENTQKSETQQIELHYDISLPYGDIVFDINGQEEPARLFGQKAQIIGLNPFLEDHISPLLSKLKGQTVTRKAALSHLSDIWDYKIFKEALNLSAQTRQSVVYKKLLSKYALALKPTTLQDVVKNADNLLNSATSAPRKNGLIVSSLIFTALFALWFLGPLQDISKQALAGTISSDTLLSGLDFLPLLLSALIISPVTQAISVQLLSSQLSGVVPEQHIATLKKRLGKTNYLAIGIVIALFAAFYVPIEYLKLL